MSENEAEREGDLGPSDNPVRDAADADVLVDPSAPSGDDSVSPSAFNEAKAEADHPDGIGNEVEEAPREDAPSSMEGAEPSDPTREGTNVLGLATPGDDVIVQGDEKSPGDVAERSNDDWRLAQELNKDNVDPLGRFH